jgi:hypothetical protein
MAPHFVRCSVFAVELLSFTIAVIFAGGCLANFVRAGMRIAKSSGPDFRQKPA